jgi:hypothetical protein
MTASQKLKVNWKTVPTRTITAGEQLKTANIKNCTIELDESAYQLGAERVLVVTFKPAVEDAGRPTSSPTWTSTAGSTFPATPTPSDAESGENSIVARHRCLECDQIEEFEQLVIEHEQLLAGHKRLQSAPFSASEHTEHRRQIAAHAAKVAAFRSRVFGAEPLPRS